MSGIIFDYHNYGGGKGATGIYSIKAGDTARHPAILPPPAHQRIIQLETVTVMSLRNPALKVCRLIHMVL